MTNLFVDQKHPELQQKIRKSKVNYSLPFPLKYWAVNHQLPICGAQSAIEMNQSHLSYSGLPFPSNTQKEQKGWSKEGVQEGTDRQRIVGALSLVEPYEQGCKSPVSLSSSLWPTDHWWDVLLRHIWTSGNNSRFLNLSKRGGGSDPCQDLLVDLILWTEANLKW